MKHLSIGSQHWRRLALRERRAVQVMVVVVSLATFWLLVWQPSSERLSQARHAYAQQLALMAQMAKVGPVTGLGAPPPTSSYLNDTALAAGLQVSRFDVDPDALNMTLAGESAAMLAWLQRMEVRGVRFESLQLDVSEARLRLRLVAVLPAG